MIRFAENADIEQLKKLWNIAFPEDGDDFINFYFSIKNHHKQTLVQECEGKIVAMLEMIPYKMTYFDELIDVYYFSGLNTLPDFQGQGLMKQLIEKSFQIAFKQKCDCIALIPQQQSIVNFYKQFDFEQIFEYQENNIHIEQKSFPLEKVVENNIVEAYHFFYQQTLNRKFCIQKTMDDFRVIVQDCYLLNGTPFLLRKNGNIVAMAFCFCETEGLKIKDILYVSMDYKQQLLSAIACFYQKNTLKIIEPHNNQSENQSFACGMLRLITISKLIQIFQKNNPTLLSFSFQDNFIAENNRYFGTKQEKMLSLNHKELCNYLFGNQKEKPFMNLMLD